MQVPIPAFPPVFHFLRGKPSRFMILTESRQTNTILSLSTATVPSSARKTVLSERQIMPHPGLRILFPGLTKPVMLPFLLPVHWSSVKYAPLIPIITEKLKANMPTGWSFVIFLPRLSAFPVIIYRIKKTISSFFLCRTKLLLRASISSSTAARNMPLFRRILLIFLPRFPSALMPISSG